MVAHSLLTAVIIIVGWDCLLLVETRSVENPARNERPIIGIAAQEPPDFFLTTADTYVFATYVRFLQQAGARVVIVRAGEPLEYYIDLFYKLNGMVIPGGIVDPLNSLYARTATIFYNLAVEANKKGDYFPLWGVCLGIQQLALLTVAGEEIRNETDAENLTLPLDFAEGFRESRMFSQAPENVVRFLAEEPLAHNNHEFGILLDVYNNNPTLKNFYRVLTTNTGRRGHRFVSTMEAIDYPFYGLQWHPEKIAYMWSLLLDINHGRHAVRVAQYFANFFVDEARKSFHRFPTAEEEMAADVNNYNSVFFTDGTYFEVYFFNFTQNAYANGITVTYAPQTEDN